MKGVFHLHTHHSFDCLTSPKKIVLNAVKNGLDLVVITDHDTLQGSIEARKMVQKLKLAIEIPIGGEFTTDIGDVIVINVADTFTPHFSHVKLCTQAKEQGGITILPHPYDGHTLENIHFDLIDGIEVYNSRSSETHNAKAEALALKLGKPYLYGADAHFLQDMMNCCFEGSLMHSAKPLMKKTTPPYRLALSQMIKGIKQRDGMLFLRSAKKIFKGIFSCEWY